jgi:hypothetical protein
MVFGIPRIEALAVGFHLGRTGQQDYQSSLHKGNVLEVQE